MNRSPLALTQTRTAESGVPGLAALADAVGRVLVASLFLYSGWFDMAAHWPAVVDVVAARGLPVPPLIAGAAMTVEIAAPILLFVPRTRALATAALAAYCVLTAILFHADGLLQGTEVTDDGFHFFKNLALAGALLTSLARGRGRDGRGE
jgi:putative oxidoreductase